MVGASHAIYRRFRCSNGVVATTVYGTTLLMASLLLSVLWRHALRALLVRPDVANEVVEVLTRSLTPGWPATWHGSPLGRCVP